jgi:hypothetical protein
MITTQTMMGEYLFYEKAQNLKDLAEETAKPPPRKTLLKKNKEG